MHKNSGIFESEKTKKNQRAKEYYGNALTGLLASGKYSDKEFEKVVRDAYQVSLTACEYIDSKNEPNILKNLGKIFRF